MMLTTKRILEDTLKDYDNLDLSKELSDEFFNKFNHPKDKVLLVISTYPLRDKILLYKRYGKSYNGPLNTFEILFINETILHKLQKALDSLDVTRKLVYLRDIINEDEELIITVSKKCDLYDYLSNKFGKDLKQPILISYKNIDNAIYREKKEKLQREIQKFKGIHRIKLIKPFHEKFIKFKRADESYEDFAKRVNKIVFAHLNETLLGEVKLTYNENLLNVIDCGRYKKGETHTERLLKAYNIVKLYLIKQNERVNNPRHYSPVESILREDINLEELLVELAKINVRTLELMKLKYGEDYQHPSVVATLSKEDNKYLTDTILYARKRIRARHK